MMVNGPVPAGLYAEVGVQSLSPMLLGPLPKESGSWYWETMFPVAPSRPTTWAVEPLYSTTNIVPSARIANSAARAPGEPKYQDWLPVAPSTRIREFTS